MATPAAAMEAAALSLIELHAALLPNLLSPRVSELDCQTENIFMEDISFFTGFSSEIGTKLRDWAVGQAWGSCYSWAALSSNDSKTL